MKKRLTQGEEFEILKLVIDKFLWLGFGIMALGLYRIFAVSTVNIYREFSFMIAGGIILVILLYLLVKEYELLK
ncbi:hypothetical protein K9M79_00515 [Candidatus Woesearchaeota archaeon]|nr:hypothetical protein [Candidatus Woesearchaeota archaeon]